MTTVFLLLLFCCFTQLVNSHHNSSHSLSRRSPTSCPISCSLPSCSCGREIPGGFQSTQVPQFVLLTFDDAVNGLNKDFYERLFTPSRKIPNGCGIKATFYVSHEWTDYGQVHDLYLEGHEVASHTVTHTWPDGFSADRWAKEVVGMAELLVQHANVDPTHIKGMRAPFLKTGGDVMFSQLSKYGMWYDSSLPSTQASPPLWPYTLDQPPPHSCSIPPCPTKSHPGLWEVPMSYMEDDQGGHCAMLDGCTYPEDTTAGIQRMLTRNFIRHYTSSNKAPVPLFYHAAWFRLRPHREEALHKFLDSILELPDVYFVTTKQLVEWVRNPSSLNQPHPALTCPSTPSPSSCVKKQRCTYGERFLDTCSQSCPPQYPWV